MPYSILEPENLYHNPDYVSICVAYLNDRTTKLAKIVEEMK